MYVQIHQSAYTTNYYLINTIYLFTRQSPVPSKRWVNSVANKYKQTNVIQLINLGLGNTQTRSYGGTARSDPLRAHSPVRLRAHSPVRKASRRCKYSIFQVFEKKWFRQCIFDGFLWIGSERNLKCTKPKSFDNCVYKEPLGVRPYRNKSPFASSPNKRKSVAHARKSILPLN